MSLNDVDKSGDARTQPQPNAADGMDLGAVKAHATEGIAYRSEDAVTAPRVITKDDQLIVHDGTSNIALFGRDGSGNYVVKVAKPTYDVLVATDDQLIFNSADNVFKIVDKPNVSFSLTSGATPASTTVTITHNKGYEPLILPSVNITNNGVSAGQTGIFGMPYFVAGTTSGAGNAIIMLAYVKQLKVTTTTATFEIGVEGGTINIAGTITAYILQETAN